MQKGWLFVKINCLLNILTIQHDQMFGWFGEWKLNVKIKKKNAKSQNLFNQNRNLTSLAEFIVKGFVVTIGNLQTNEKWERIKPRARAWLWRKNGKIKKDSTATSQFVVLCQPKERPRQLGATILLHAPGKVSMIWAFDSLQNKLGEKVRLWAL